MTETKQQEDVKTIRRQYLHLMKKVLTYSLWMDPPIPLSASHYTGPTVKRWIFSFLEFCLSRRHLCIARVRKPTMSERVEGTYWPGCADTMIGTRRLENVQECIQTVLRDGVDGDLIETGVWRGGTCIFMRAILAAYGIKDRRVFVADSFRGLPPPNPRYPADRDDIHHTYGDLAVSRQSVEANFAKYELLDEQVQFLEGWFSETLSDERIKKLAVLRLDGDMYGSTMDAIEALYPKLSPGGFCIVDDYALPGCKKAIDDYRLQHGINTQLVRIDWTGVYWRR